MLSFTVRMRFEEADHDAIRQHLIALTHGSRQEPGCVSYIAHFISDDPSTVLIYEQYVDDTALEAHRNTPHFKEHAIGGLYQRMRERWRTSPHSLDSRPIQRRGASYEPLF